VEHLASLHKTVFMATSYSIKRLDVLREDQTLRWQEGACPLVEDYLKAHPDLSDEDAMVLIVGELLLRWEAGQRPKIEEYQQRLPKYAQQIAFQFELNESLDGDLIDYSDDDDDDDFGEYRPLAPREMIPGYILGPELGRGPHALVYQATNESLKRMVALKIFDLNPARDTHASTKFVERGRHLVKLHHPNLLRVIEAGRSSQSLYLALELCQGETLKQRLAKQSLTVSEVVNIMEQLAQGAKYAHDRGIVLGNIHPNNIMFGLNDDAKHTDFWMVPTTRESPYASPQRTGVSQEMDPTWDIYSLGVVFYECLTGRLPDKPYPVPLDRLNPAIPTELSRIVMRCLEASPDRRFATGSELVVELRKLSQNDPLRASSTTNSSLQRVRNFDWRWILVAGIGVLVLLIALWFLFFR
jgi:eukaryotic-like serine/threonine-protein kinase